MVKGIIFDFNGTLYFNTDKQEEAWQILVKKYYGRDIQQNKAVKTIIENFSGFTERFL